MSPAGGGGRDRAAGARGGPGRRGRGRQRRRRGAGGGVRRDGHRAGHGQLRRRLLRRRSGPPTATRSSSTATSRCRVAGSPRTASAAACARSSRRTAAGSPCTRVTAPSRRRASCRRSGWPTSGYARLPWARLVAPAASAARHGYPMSHAAARYLSITADTLFATDPEAHALVTRARRLAARRRRGGPQRRASPTSSTTSRPPGPDLFAGGEVGRGLVAEMEHGGGLVTADDLAAYQPVVRPAYVLDVGDWSIATNPPPVGRRSDARRDARRAGAPRATGPGRTRWRSSTRCCPTAPRCTTSPDDLDQDGRALLDAVGERGLAALRGSASTAHISADRRRGHRLRDHHEQRVRRGARASRAPASCSTTASARPSSTGTACTPYRPAPGSPPTWRRPPAGPPTAGRWRSAPPAPTGSPPR